MIQNFREKIQKMSSKAYINYILIIIASIVICLPLASKNLDIYRDDGVQHVCRLIGTFQTLESGEFLPMIMTNLCNNFGYSWNIFYSPLTAYAPLIFKLFNFSFVNCLKIFMFMVTLLSGIAMYKFVEKVTKNNKIALLASIIYILAPYRITDMYIRVAIAELTSFIFIPIIFSGLYALLNEEKKSFTLAWGTIGLILTHTVITFYMAIICFIYLLVFIKKLKNKDVLKSLLLNLLVIVLATSFYLVGMLQHYFATSYEVFVPGRMEVGDKLEYYKTKFFQLFITKKDDPMIYAIGLVTIIGLILTPIVWNKIEKNYKKIYVLFLILGLILVFMTLTFFPFEKLPGIFRMIQFTFRLFEFTSFFFAFVSAINYGILIKNFNTGDVIVLLIISGLLLIPYKDKLDFEVKRNEEDLVNGVEVTQNIGRIHAGMASMEYLPSKAFNVLKTYIATREDVPIVLNDGNAIISNYEKDGTNMHFDISNVETDTKVELPYIYYLGYKVYANGQEIKYTESDNGFIEINVAKDMEDEGEADTINIVVKYTGTNAMILATVISTISLLFLIFYSKISMQKIEGFK